MEKVVIKKEYEVAYSSSDKFAYLKLQMLTKWFEDLLFEQDKKFNQREKSKGAWILLTYDIDISNMPKLGDKVDFYTYASSFTKFYGNRVFGVKTKAGEEIISAKTKWILIDKETKNIKKVTEDIGAMYGVPSISKGRGYEIDKISEEYFDIFSSEEIKEISKNNKDEIISFKKGELEVRRDDIDFNNHVNNTAYFSYIFECIEEEVYESKKIQNIQINYKNEIRYENKPEYQIINYINSDKKLVSIIKMFEDEKIFTLIKINWEEK